MFLTKLFKRKHKNKLNIESFHESILVNNFEEPESGGQLTHIDQFEHPIRGIPRGWVLNFLDPIKRFFRNSLENDIYKFLPDGEKTPELVKKTFGFTKWLEEHIRMKAWELIKHEVPYEKMSEPVKEFWRLFDEVLDEFTFMIEKMKDWKKLICLFLEEDTAYRYRVQWLLERLDKKGLSKNPVNEMCRLFDLLIDAEKTEGMKMKWRVIKKSFRLLMLGSPDYRRALQFGLLKLNKKKIKLTEGDKEYFRCKFFKVD